MDSHIPPSPRPRKVRFPPREPPRRAAKPPEAKSESTIKEGGADKDENRALPPEVTTTDYKRSYDPITLPFRKSFSGDPEFRDEEKFGGAAAATEYDENTLNAASDLGLQEEVDDVKMLFFQLPSRVPFERPTSTDRLGTEVAQHTSTGDMSTSSSVGGNASKEGCRLEELPAGRVGKLLVYKSGDVKLKMGDILFDVFPGPDSSFFQEIVAVNTKEKQCCSLGKPHNMSAIVTPDVDLLLSESEERGN